MSNSVFPMIRVSDFTKTYNDFVAVRANIR